MPAPTDRTTTRSRRPHGPSRRATGLAALTFGLAAALAACGGDDTDGGVVGAADGGGDATQAYCDFIDQDIGGGALPFLSFFSERYDIDVFGFESWNELTPPDEIREEWETIADALQSPDLEGSGDSPAISTERIRDEYSVLRDFVDEHCVGG